MIVISPFSKRCMNGRDNPKNYPYWKELIKLIDEPIIQVGIKGEEPLVYDFRENLSVLQLRQLIRECRTWISCDSFFQHLGWDEGKKGIVLWGQSDPLIFGHPENVNLLQSREFLRPNQFLWWEDVPYIEHAFVKPEIVLQHLLELH